MSSRVLQVNSRVVSERFGDEVVLIHIEKGLYFSLLGSAVDLWAQFEQPRPIDDVVSAFARRYGEVDVDALRGAVDTFLECDLLQENPFATEHCAPPAAPSLDVFSPPRVDVFNDLAELIAIDPVHEVDQSAGWPVRPPNFPGI